MKNRGTDSILSSAGITKEAQNATTESIFFSLLKNLDKLGPQKGRVAPVKVNCSRYFSWFLTSLKVKGLCRCGTSCGCLTQIYDAGCSQKSLISIIKRYQHYTDNIIVNLSLVLPSDLCFRGLCDRHSKHLPLNEANCETYPFSLSVCCTGKVRLRVAVPDL